MNKRKRETLNYWEARAKNATDVKAITHADIFQRQLEIDTITRYINKNDCILDIGCGNGYSTAIFYDYCREIMGVDFSSEMIKRARRENSKNGRINYTIADARELRLGKKFSKIITERCLINILDWTGQKRAIQNIANHVEPGGYCLMMEGISNGRAELNKVRINLGLNRLSCVPYNLDFERERTESFFRRFFNIEGFKTFGIYELITRIIYPLYIYPKEPAYGSRFHKIALKICENVPDCIPDISKLGLWILRRKKD